MDGYNMKLDKDTQLYLYSRLDRLYELLSSEREEELFIDLQDLIEEVQYIETTN